MYSFKISINFVINFINDRFKYIFLFSGLIKREPKVVFVSTNPRHKNKVNRIINNENNNNRTYLENKYKSGYNRAINKTENNSSILDKVDDFYCICHH